MTKYPPTPAGRLLFGSPDGKSPPPRSKRRPINNRIERPRDHSTWTVLPFGKHKRKKTLPQIICSDPAWFLWAVGEDIFSGKLGREAAILHKRIQGIRIPKRRPKKWVVEYSYDCDGRFQEFYFVKKVDDPYLKYNLQSAHLDLTSIDTRHRGEWRYFLQSFRESFFDGESMTKERCESFFSNESNFV